MKILKTLAVACALALLMLAPAKALDLSIDGNVRGQCGTASATGGTATLANKCGVITSAALTTAPGSDYSLTLTNTVAEAGDIVLWSVSNGTNTVGELIPVRATATSDTITFVVKNLTEGPGGVDGATLNGTIKINYFLFKP